MKQTFQWKIAALLVGTSCTLTNCAKEQDAQPASQIATITDNQVKVVNDRLVFADQKAFEQLSEKLHQMSNYATNSQELATWEKSVRFTSLRAAAAKEEAQLEQLDTQGKPAVAHELMTKFGFPISYAAIISPLGEYQIGSKIYWFHDGFKYQADSEEELSTVKLNQASAKVKFQAGYRVVDNKNATESGKVSGTTANVTVQSLDPYANDKYVSSTFGYRGDTGSPRRIIYATHVYVEDRGVSNSRQTFYTELDLFIKYEYYSRGSGKWYPANESFTWSAYIDGSYSPGVNRTSYTLDFMYPTGPSGNSLQGTYSNGIQSISLAYAYLKTAPYVTGPTEVYWYFSLKGGIDSHPTNDNLSSSRYVVGSKTPDYNGLYPTIW